jgi:hypothetical protein
MEPPSPARLYATLVGAVLFVALLVAGIAPRPYALGAGLVFTGLAIADFSSRGWPHLAVGLLGLAAFAASRGSKSTHDVEKEPRKRSKRLKPRAQAAAKGS